MKRTAYQTAVAKLHTASNAPGMVPLTRDECVALLDALRDLTEAAGRPPRGAVETDPPGVMPLAAVETACDAVEVE